MFHCFFVTDLHGRVPRFNKLISAVESGKPDIVFIGGDIVPGLSLSSIHEDFIGDWLLPRFVELRDDMGPEYPYIFIILGNDDPRLEERSILSGEVKGLWTYIHNRKLRLNEYTVYGLSFVPPTPFTLKDWERYDISRFVDPGSSHPWEGYHSIPPSEDLKYETIKRYLERLTGTDDLSRGIFLFHAPPHGTGLDRAALDGVKIEGVPIDRHVGSIAILEFIRTRMPLLTLHGHIHESTRLTGKWKEEIARTVCINGACEPPHLAITEFSLDNVNAAEQHIVECP
jgi:Icc-related predicted phosphoesterase